MTIELIKDEMDGRVADLVIRLKTLPYFSDLSAETLEMMASMVQEVQINAGMQVIRPGDMENDFYIIDQGQVKKETLDEFGIPICIRTLTRGQFFGHFSLLHNVPILVSIIVVNPAYLLKISQSDFRSLIDKCADFKEVFDLKTVRDAGFRDRIRFLSFFDKLSENELNKVVTAVNVQHLKADSDFKKQVGSTELAVLCSGQILVTNPHAPNLQKISISRGNFVSKLPDLKNISFEVTQDSTIFTLDRDAVKKLMGEIESIDLQKVVNRKVIIDHLKQVKLFEQFDPADLQLFAWVTSQASFSGGQYICRQGDPGIRYFIFHQGQIELRVLKPNGKQPHDGAKTLLIGQQPAEAAEKSNSEQVELYDLGERAIFLGQPYSQSIWAVDNTDFLFIDKPNFDYIRKNNQGISTIFKPEQSVAHVFQYSSFDFPGKSDEEEVIYYCRRHPISILFGLFKVPGVDRLKYTGEWRNRIPSAETIMFALVIMGLLFWWVTTEFSLDIVPSLDTLWGIDYIIDYIYVILTCFSSVIFGWVLWNYADWQNDYFVITTERILRREKIILLYEDQAEAELGKLQKFDISKKFLGTMLGYYNLIINTAAADSVIEFDRAPAPSKLQEWLSNIPLIKRFVPKPHPTYADKVLSQIITEQSGFGQAVSARLARVRLQDAIRSQMTASQVDPWDASEPDKAPSPKLTRLQTYRKNSLSLFTTFWDTIIPWRDLNAKHNPSKNTYVWRKHWLILIRDTWDATLSFVLFTGLVIIYFFGLSTIPFLPPPTSGIALPVTLTILAVYMSIAFRFWYLWADWGNDLYILTEKEVIDIEKKPLFQSENRSQSDLDKIENVVFTQKGLLDNLFNIGDVTITMAGGDPLDFNRVSNPRFVQNQIFELSQKARSAAAAKSTAAKQKEFTQWFDVYHDTFINVERC